MNILKELELIDVQYTKDNHKATLIFLDEENGEIREINFNKQVFDEGKGVYIDDSDKAEKVEGWAKEHFAQTFANLEKAIGVKKDIYVYDKFNSLTEMDIVEKFGPDMVGQIVSVQIVEIIDDGIGIKIRYEYDGSKYESKLTYSEYVESRKQWFVNPQKKVKQYDRFKKLFHIPFEEREKAIGVTAMVEIRIFMGKYVWNDFKALPKPKEKK